MKKGHSLKNENKINIVIHNDKKKNIKRKRRTTASKQKYTTSLTNLPQGGQAPVFFQPQNELNRLAHNYIQEDTRFALPVIPKRDVDNLHDVVYQAIEDAKPTVQRMIEDQKPTVQKMIKDAMPKKQKKTYNLLKTNTGLDNITKNGYIQKLKDLGIYKTKYNTKSKMAQALGEYMKSNTPIVEEPNTPMSPSKTRSKLEKAKIVSDKQNALSWAQKEYGAENVGKPEFISPRKIRIRPTNFESQSPVNQPDFSFSNDIPNISI